MIFLYGKVESIKICRLVADQASALVVGGSPTAAKRTPTSAKRGNDKDYGEKFILFKLETLLSKYALSIFLGSFFLLMFISKYS
jgi:hypothetical protein